MWFVYILYSNKLDRYYTGSTDDLEWRLERHNSGWGRFTKKGIPWKLVYNEEYTTKSAALKREREIKKKKSRKYIEELISHAGGRPD
jgi:putative endonuclease